MTSSVGGAESRTLEDVRRVLVLRANGIGDFLMVVPALSALRRTYPDAELTVVGDAWLPGLVEGRPGPWDRCLVAPAYPGLRGLPTTAAAGPDVPPFVAARRAEHLDVALQLHGGGATSNRFVASLGARVTAGARDVDASPLDRTVAYLPHRHEVLRWLDVAALVGADRLHTLDDLVPRLCVTERDAAAARGAVPPGELYVAIHLGARDARRRWPTERFVEVARRVLGRGLRVVLVGGADTRAFSARAATELDRPGRVVDLAGRLSLSGTIGVLAGAAAFVGNDSGPRHLATAVGTPTVGIYWHSNAVSFGPLVGDRDRALVSDQLRCPVCGAEQVTHRCGHDVSFVDAITVDEVEAALSAVLADRPRAAAPAVAQGTCR